MKRRIRFKRTLALLLALILALPLSALAEAVQSDAAAVAEPADVRADVSEETEREIDGEPEAPDIPAEADELPSPEAAAPDEAAPEEDGAPAALSVRVEPGEGAVLRAVIEADGAADCRWQAVEREAYLEAFSAGSDTEALWADIEGAQGDALDAGAAFGERYAEYSYRCVARSLEREVISEPYSFPEAPAEDAPVEAPEEGEPAGEEVTGEIHPLFAQELSFAEDRINIGKGETYRPALRSEGAGTLFFESSKPGVFSVDSRTGEITGIKTGKGALTVSDGLRDASVPVQVYAAPKKFSLLPGELTMGVGEEVILQPKLPSKTAGHIVSGSSSDAGVATVEGQTVRAVAEGEATITAELFNGKKATCKVTVRRAPEAGMMYLHTPMGRDNYEMGVGETMQITLSYPEGYAGGYTFSSGDESVISIDARSGKATAHSVGRATIYATAYNGVQDQREFTVKAKPGSLSIQSVPRTMGVGEEFDLFPVLSNKAGEECGGGATYKSSKPGVVQVLLYSGYAHLVAKKTGKAKITVTTYNKLKKSVTITVKKAPTEIEIEPDELELGVGESGVKLKPVFRKKGSFANVRWSSEKPDVVRVDEKGVLIPVAPGSARVRGEITLRDADGNTETIGSSSYVTVKPEPVAGDGELSFPQADGAEKLMLGVGETMRAELIFGNGAGGGRKFKSSKKGVASVDASGLVKGKKTGKATITATMYNGVRLSKTIQVVSAPKKIEIINLPPEGFNLRYGEQWDLDVKITDKKKKTIEGVGYTFESGNPSDVEVDPCTGLVTAMDLTGYVTISARTYNGKSASIYISVNSDPNRCIALRDPNGETISSFDSITAGQSLMCNLELVNGADRTPRNVKWWSEDESVARVEDGRVTAVSPGTVLIYVSADDPDEPERRVAKSYLFLIKEPVYGISLDHSSLTLTQGQRATLTPTLTGLDGVSASSIRWESSDAQVVNVSNGELEALSSGTATVTASLDDPNAPGNVLKAECLVTVERAPFGISLDRTELKLMAGQRATLTATLTNLPGASQSDVTWQSSDDGVATVQAGSVKAVAEGSATITASIEDPEEPGSILKAQCAVTVEKATYGIFLDRGELTLYEGGSAALTASLTGFPEGEEPEITWSSSRDSVATVQGGTVSAVAPGTATITASAANPLNPQEPLTAECAVTVGKIFALSAERLSLEVGDTATLTATLRGEAIPSESITWTSGRDAVATVQNGRVTAVAGGEATIQASYNDNGTTRTAQCQVSVDLQAWQEPPKAEEPKVTEDGRVELTWEPSASEGASDTYAVYEIVDGVEILRGTVTGNRMELSGVTAGEHTYIVRPRERRGLQWVVGESSETVTVTVEDWAASPRLNSVEETEVGSVALSWSAVSGAQRYAIYELASDDTLTKLQEVSGTSVTLSGVPGGWHRYAVRTLVDGKQGNLSNVLGADVTSLKLDRESAQIEIGATVQLSATLNLPAGADQSLSWKSSDPAIATVDGAGLVTGVTGGTATISATCSDGGTERCQVSVIPLNQQDSDFVIVDGVLKEYNGTAEYVVIPEGVTKIESADSYTSVFKNNDALKGVVIPYGVKEIGDYAFFGCSSLTSITIPNSVSGIDLCAFQDCSSLESITIPNSVTFIGEHVFENCSSLTSVTIPNGVKYIWNSLFVGCSSLTSITIPNSVTRIDLNAFQDCSSLANITIPNSVTYIGASAFQGCSSLTSITIPDGVTYIGQHTFFYCSSLKSITIPDGVTDIGWEAFKGCSSLPSIAIPDSVKSIGYEAFKDCNSLTSISIPNSMTSISWETFENCSNLTSITMPDSVTSFGDEAFNGCSSLTNITIPNSLTDIGQRTFLDCSSLTSITIPNSVMEIGWDAIPATITIICYPGSTAEAYAKKNGNPIMYIGGQSDSNIHLVNGTLTVGTGMLVDLNELMNTSDRALLGDVDDPAVASFDTSTGGAMLKILAPGETNVHVGEIASVGQTDWIDTNFTLKAVGFKQAQHSIPVGKTTSQSPVGISGTWSSSNESVATVDQSGTVTGVSAGAANIIITRSDGLWASYTVTVGDPATAITASPAYMFLGIGESGKLSSYIASGFACTGVTFESADQAIARVDADGNVTGVSTGRTQVFVISADDPSVRASCDVAVASEGETRADLEAKLRKIEQIYGIWVNAHGRFEGYYINDKGESIPAIDLSKVTDSWYAQLYDTLGDNVRGIDVQLTRELYVAEQIMSELTRMADCTRIKKLDLEKILSAVGFTEPMIENFFWFAKIDDAAEELNLKDMSVDEYEEWFSNEKEYGDLDFIKGLSKSKELADIVVGIFDTIQTYEQYSQVDKSELMRVVNSLEQTGDKELGEVAGFLRMMGSSKENLIAYLAVTNGFGTLEDKVIDFMKDFVTEQLKNIPFVGPFFKGAEIGMSIGFAIANSSVMNVSGLQAAACKQQYATLAASKYLPTFKAAYAQFEKNPLDESNYVAFLSASETYSRMLTMEHSAFADYASQCDESEVLKILDWIKSIDVDYSLQAKSFEGLAMYYRSWLTRNIQNFETASGGAGAN